MTVMDFRKPSTWPADVVQVLMADMDGLADWFLDRPGKLAAFFDGAVGRLEAVLVRHEVVGFHCTRLTNSEIETILSQGLQMPDAAMLETRIAARVSEGHFDTEMAAALLARHQAGDKNRKGRVWFCLFPPWRAGRHGIERFFKHWGGEALYNSHERDEKTSPVLQAFGTPCILEVRLPISDIKLDFATLNIMKRFLESRGFEGVEQNDSEVQLIVPVGPERITALHRSPSLEFARLTRMTF